MTTRVITHPSGTGTETANAFVLLNPATGQAFTSLPVTLSGESLTVSVPASVEISNDVGNPIPVSLASAPGLTDTQLRATPVNMLAATRAVLGGERITVPTTGATLASLLTGAAFPVGTVAVELQADGGVVRVTRAATNTPTASVGYRLDDGMEKLFDTLPTAIKVCAVTGSTYLNVVCFDRV